MRFWLSACAAVRHMKISEAVATAYVSTAASWSLDRANPVSVFGVMKFATPVLAVLILASLMANAQREA